MIYQHKRVGGFLANVQLNQVQSPSARNIDKHSWTERNNQYRQFAIQKQSRV